MTSLTMNLPEESSLEEKKPLTEPQQEHEEIVSVGSEDTTSQSKGAYEAFVQEIGQIAEIDKKIEKVLEFMELSIAQKGAPHFRQFWDARKLCIDLFKDHSLSPTQRAHYWTRYTELSKEAYRLKEILDEQSAFAAEQIDIAIKALESDLQNSADVLKQTAGVEFNPPSNSFATRLEYYANVQKELNLLNTHASRVNALRKELLKTPMRLKVKNKFFQRLSVAGDAIFPRRKDLIKEVSQQFTLDVDAFIKTHFAGDHFSQPLFFLRDEIKAIQGMAKILTLNTAAFTHTRMSLSSSWDRIKKLEKEKKKERLEQKAVSKESADLLLHKLKAFEEEYVEGKLSAGAAQDRLNSIQSEMREQRLDRDQVNEIRQELNRLRDLVGEKLRLEDEERKNRANEAKKAQQAVLHGFKAELDVLMNNAATQSVDQLTQMKEDFVKRVQNAEIHKSEKAELERRAQGLNEVISRLKIEQLPADKRQALDQVAQFLREQQENRKKIAAQVDAYRKAAGGSGLDFAQAMKQQELLKEERARLEKIDEAIAQLHEKIEQLEGE